MFRRLIIFLGLLLFLLIAAAAWNIRQAGKPMNADEIPQWKLIQETQDSILLQSVAEPDRKTEAFLLEKPEDINGWGIFDWWNLPHRFRKEYLQNLGAMKALIDYIQSKASAGRSRFSGRVVLAGGSAGAPVPAMITGFYPEKVSGLMIIFGFTNIKAVINNEIYRQGLIRLKITDSEEGLQFSIQRGFLKFGI